jgi:small-conductance mechanosensitive channel
MWSRFFSDDIAWAPIVLAVVPTLVLAWAAARLVRRLAARGLRAILHDTLAESSPLVRGPLRLLGLAAFLLVTALVLVPAFELAGLHPRRGVHLGELVAWALGDGLRVVLIVLLAYASIRATTLVVRRFEHEVAAGSTLDVLERAKRARTLGTAVSKVSTVLIVSIAALMILQLFRIDIAPVLTGAGIAGLAVGFGAQTLVRDVISGFFLLLEDQVRVGDVAAINGTGGLVEQLNLRTIVLRDTEGTVHVFPNGAITTLANRSKEFSYYVIDLNVSYREDPDRIIALLAVIGAQLQADARFGPLILAPLEILGVDGFADWWMVVKMRIKTVPLKQWEVGRQLRKRIKQTFDAEGIDMPAPAPVMHVHQPGAAPPASSPTTTPESPTGPGTAARS